MSKVKAKSKKGVRVKKTGKNNSKLNANLFYLTALMLACFALFLTIYIIRTNPSSPLMPKSDIKASEKLTTATPKATSPTSPVVNKKGAIYQPQIYGNQLRVPILMYHYIGNNPNPADTQRTSLSTGPVAFEEQIKYLADNGYTAISLDTLYAAFKKQVALPNKPLIITFDDGYEDFYYNAYPILQKYNIHATVFIPTALMDQGYYLKWSQIQEMGASGLITFGSHGVHHYRSESLPEVSLEAELTESKQTLQSKLGVPINFFAYPYGTLNGNVIEAVKKAGYIGAVGTWPERTQSEGTIYNMPRIRIGGGISISTFMSLL